jgi:hypothetical protein
MPLGTDCDRTTIVEVVLIRKRRQDSLADTLPYAFERGVTVVRVETRFDVQRRLAVARAGQGQFVRTKVNGTTDGRSTHWDADAQRGEASLATIVRSIRQSCRTMRLRWRIGAARGQRS